MFYDVNFRVILLLGPELGNKQYKISNPLFCYEALNHSQTVAVVCVQLLS